MALMCSVCQFVFIHCIRPALKTAFNPYEFINNLNNKLFVFSTSVILIPPENYHPVHVATHYQDYNLFFQTER